MVSRQTEKSYDDHRSGCRKLVTSRHVKEINGLLERTAVSQLVNLAAEYTAVLGLCTVLFSNLI
jgi:hypothetical protein